MYLYTHSLTHSLTHLHTLTHSHTLTLQSIKEHPWLAFFSLCAEQVFEEKEGIWKQLLRQLKKDTKISVDSALKVMI